MVYSICLMKSASQSPTLKAVFHRGRRHCLEEQGKGEREEKFMQFLTNQILVFYYIQFLKLKVFYLLKYLLWRPLPCYTQAFHPARPSRSLGSIPVSLSGPSLRAPCLTPRSIPTLQAWITMPILHTSPVPCIHLTSLH